MVRLRRRNDNGERPWRLGEDHQPATVGVREADTDEPARPLVVANDDGVTGPAAGGDDELYGTTEAVHLRARKLRGTETDSGDDLVTPEAGMVNSRRQLPEPGLEHHELDAALKLTACDRDGDLCACGGTGEAAATVTEYAARHYLGIAARSATRLWVLRAICCMRRRRSDAECKHGCREQRPESYVDQGSSFDKGRNDCYPFQACQPGRLSEDRGGAVPPPC